MRNLFTLIAVVCLSAMGAQAQSNYPLVDLTEVQRVDPQDLANCDDASIRVGDTVRVRGVVVTPGSASAIFDDVRQVFIQTGTEEWQAANVFGGGSATTPVDMLNLVAGDSVELLGEISEFSNEVTQLEIVEVSGEPSVQLLGQGIETHVVTSLTIGDFNDENRNNKLESGEPWEAHYVEFTDLTVSQVYNFTGSRYSFDVVDANGDQMNVSDGFFAQRTPAEGGNFTPPSVGAKLDTLRGILNHSKNNCPGENGRGYEIDPFKSSDYVYGDIAPLISNLDTDPTTPTSSEDITFSAEVSDDGTVQEVKLFYAINQEANYDSVVMSNTSGNVYEYTLSAQSDGDRIYYYIKAVDDQNFVNILPNVEQGTAPRLCVVRNDGLQIYDLQFTTNSNGNSPFNGQTITTSGIVVASAEEDNLGYVYIQQENLQTWAGIRLQGAGLASLKVGDEVEVTGKVAEDFGMTILEDVSQVSVTGSGEVDPIYLSASIFSDYDFQTNEPYEGMLIGLTEGNDKTYIVDENPDGPDNNFAEYLVGPDTLDPSTACRVLAGRQTGSAFSSLNFSYVNDSSWEAQSGAMKVDLQVIEYGESFDTLIGMMAYSFGNMKLTPRNNDDMIGYSQDIDTTDTTSIQEPILASSDFRLYPNPAEGDVYVMLVNTKLQEEVELNILNTTGQTVRNGVISPNALENINISELTSGFYLVQLRNESGEVISKRLIVE